MQAQLPSSVNHALQALVADIARDPHCIALRPARLFCVGGAVRDVLMQRQVTDRDWLVVGSTPEQMIGAGFLAVGRDFPVFLHPLNREEFALARTERKIGRGYHGFEFHCDPTVSLEDDLRRRDLRINAMAIDAQGRLHDPHQGYEDLQNRQLQHVSEAFREDPIRILRVARFSARFADFGIHPLTLQFMREMVRDGETDHWTAERVWRELDQGMSESKPSALWRCLASCHLSAFACLGTEDGLMLEQLDRAAAAGLDGRLRWALWSTLASSALRTAVLAILKMPGNQRSLIDQALRHQSAFMRMLSGQGMPSPALLAGFFESLDVLRRPGRLDDLLAVWRWHPQVRALSGYEHALGAIKDLGTIFRRAKSGALGTEIQGAALGEAIRQARVQALSMTLLTRYAQGILVPAPTSSENSSPP